MALNLNDYKTYANESTNLYATEDSFRSLNESFLFPTPSTVSFNASEVNYTMTEEMAAYNASDEFFFTTKMMFNTSETDYSISGDDDLSFPTKSTFNASEDVAFTTEKMLTFNTSEDMLLSTFKTIYQMSNMSINESFAPTELIATLNLSSYESTETPFSTILEDNMTSTIKMFAMGTSISSTSDEEEWLDHVNLTEALFNITNIWPTTMINMTSMPAEAENLTFSNENDTFELTTSNTTEGNSSTTQQFSFTDFPTTNVTTIPKSSIIPPIASNSSFDPCSTCGTSLFFHKKIAGDQEIWKVSFSNFFDEQNCTCFKSSRFLIT